MPENLSDLIFIFLRLIFLLIPVIFGLTILTFFWGLVRFIGKAGDTKSHEEGKNLMIWGLIGLFIMLSLFGILRFFYGDLGFDSVRPFGLPVLPDGS